MTLTRNNTNDPLSPPARRVADAFWRACLGKEQTFKNDMIALAAALRALTNENAYEVTGDGWYSLVVDVDDILSIADELEGAQ